MIKRKRFVYKPNPVVSYTTAFSIVVLSLSMGCAFEASKEGSGDILGDNVAFSENSSDSVENGRVVQSLKDGISTAKKSGIGTVNMNGAGCTAALISPRHVLMAAHCNFHRDVLYGTNTFTAGGVTRNISRIFIIGAEEQPGQAIPPGNLDLNPDVALLELSSAIPAEKATPLNVSAGAPSYGQMVTTYGNGPNNDDCSGTSQKRFYTFSFGNRTDQFCPGDSGGPATYGSNAEDGAIWGVTSFISANGDVWGDVSRFKEDILSVIRMWNYNGSGGITGLESGFRRNGAVYKAYTSTSAASCRTKCNADTSCNSFRHTTSTNTCRLQRDAGDWVPDPDATSGLSSTNRYETNINRLGFDYTNYVASLDKCSQDCSNASRCAAFSWVSNGSRCYLKEYLGLSASVAGITSGTKRGFEFYTDRPGGDYYNYQTITADVRECQAICSSDSRCQSYTYRKQIFRTSQPWGVETESRCWLKSSVPSRVTIVADPPNGNKRYISGTWRTTPSS